MAAFLDTNVIIRFLTGDDKVKYQRAFQLLKRVESGDEQVVTTHLVIAEAVWVLESRPYSLSPAEIRERILPIVALRGLRLPDKPLLMRSLDLYAQTGVDFIDAYNAVVMQKRGLERIYSYDTDFDALPGIVRAEP